jgi:hypothetical protein
MIRWLRLLAGIAIVAQGLYYHEWILIVAGISFTLMAIFNAGSCATGYCSKPADHTKKNLIETEYEEVA